MLFNSLDFLVFFPIVTGLFFALPRGGKVPLLLAASALFYMAFRPVYILILLVTIVVDYFAGIYIAGAVGLRRKAILVLSILVNCCFLGFFKYFNFLSENIGAACSLTGHSWPIGNLSVVLPIGLSFHTFQAMSYTIEVFRGRQVPESNFFVFALYVLFYPQLVAGPIERPQNLLHQFHEPHPFDEKQAADGLKLMAWGMFKKVAVADRLALLVDKVYSDPASFDGTALGAATAFFAFQIYCDFSGYSDIARGSAEVMGFKLMPNFDRPYAAASIAEFWKRWHISLSTWFKDYVYLPLGGSRVSPARWAANVMAVFLLSGLWHGANWTFVVWGALNGAYLIGEVWTAPARDRLARFLGLDRAPFLRSAVQTAATFALVCLAWVFFRSRNLSDAWLILSRLASGLGDAADPAAWERLKVLIVTALGGSKLRALLVLAALAAVQVVEFLRDRGIATRAAISSRPPWIKWPLYYGLVTATLLLAPFAPTRFIYFQF